MLRPPDSHPASCESPLGRGCDLLAAVFDLAPSFLAILEGPEHVFTRVNAAYRRLVGNRPLEGLSVRDALPEVADQDFVGILDRVYSSGEPFSVSEARVRLRRNTGHLEERFVTFVYQPLCTGDGNVNGIAVHGVDVTDQVLAREAVAERERYFRSLIEHSEDKIAVLDERGIILYESPAGERLLGRPAQEVVGRSYFDFLHPDEQERVREGLLSLPLVGEGPCRIEHRMLHEDGTWRFFETVAHARQGETGLEIVTNGRDVSVRRRSDAALRTSEARFRSVQEASTDGFMLFRSVRDTDGGIVDFEWEYANSVGAEIVGRSSEELRGQRLLEEMPGNREEGLFDAYVQVVETGEPWSMEFPYKHEGLDHVFHTRAVRVEDGFAVTFTDVTERHRAAEQLREREQRFRALVELIPQLVWSTTPDGYHDYFNQRWYDYTGMERGGDQGWNWKDYLHPDDYERTLDVWHHSLETGEPYEIEYRFRRASDGSYRWFIGRALPVRGPDGEIERWFGTCTDVHDERAALAAAEENQERFTAVTRATKDVVWDWDPSTDTVWTNETLEQVLRITPEQLDPRHDGWTRRIHDEDRERVEERFQAAVEGLEETWSDEYRFIRGDGTVAHVLDRAQMIRDDEGRLIRMVGAMTDLSERTELEEQLRQSQKMEAVGRLAGGIAHDFNNLLTVITNYTEMLLGDLSEQDPLLADVEEIRRAANRASSLTRQLLAFGRRQVIQPRTININEVVGDIEKMLRRVISEDVALSVCPSPDPPTVFADPGKVEQLILNLALNARDAMEGGGSLTISISRRTITGRDAERKQLDPGEYVALVVEDTGIGMDEHTRAQVFEPFFTTKPPGRGSGLGLSMVHGIVKQSGGYVEVESEPGDGATFTVLLPFSAKERGGTREPETASRVRHGTGAVLLVEDEDAVRNVTRRALTRCGYEVVEARNGEEALERLEEDASRYDLVLTDMIMPKMGGRALLSRMRRKGITTPAVFMSGYSETETLPTDGSGPARLLEKPFTIDQLLTAVKTAL